MWVFGYLLIQTYELKKKQEINQIIWTGSGDALNKVVACAEITKEKFKVRNFVK